jgi:hypothetical protein
VQGFYPDQPPTLTRRTHASAVLLFWRSLGISTHRRRDTGLLPHQGPTVRERALSDPIREKAEMPDALEPTRENVEQEAAQEFHGVEGQGAETVATLIVLVTKGDLAMFESH